MPEKGAQRANRVCRVFGGSALRLALDEVGNGTGAERMEVGDLSRKTLGKKRAYHRRVAGNGCLGQPALLAQVKLKLTQNYLAGTRRRGGRLDLARPEHPPQPAEGSSVTSAQLAGFASATHVVFQCRRIDLLCGESFALQPAVEVPKQAELQPARANSVALVVQLLCIGP